MNVSWCDADTRSLPRPLSEPKLKKFIVFAKPLSKAPEEPFHSISVNEYTYIFTPETCTYIHMRAHTNIQILGLKNNENVLADSFNSSQGQLLITCHFSICIHTQSAIEFLPALWIIYRLHISHMLNTFIRMNPLLLWFAMWLTH